MNFLIFYPILFLISNNLFKVYCFFLLKYLVFSTSGDPYPYRGFATPQVQNIALIYYFCNIKPDFYSHVTYIYIYDFNTITTKCSFRLFKVDRWRL